jgi:hypothetical protein
MVERKLNKCELNTRTNITNKHSKNAVKKLVIYTQMVPKRQVYTQNYVGSIAVQLNKIFCFVQEVSLT